MEMAAVSAWGLGDVLHAVALAPERLAGGVCVAPPAVELALVDRGR
jgi:hypothetical protein